MSYPAVLDEPLFFLAVLVVWFGVIYWQFCNAVGRWLVETEEVETEETE